MEGWFGRKEKPSFLSIDLETRSEVDLGKCGVYKYVEGAHWGILLFCYLFEGDEDVTMCDVASGEELPPAVLSALEDPDIIKYAWNASFERTNLSRYLGHRLDPRQWRCTMVWAAEMSLPLSLKNAAEVLKVPQQKDRAGDALIRKFSVPQKPTKSNGMKEWLEPSDLPEQWEAFKSYCKQDVRTEDAIRRRLENFPLPMSEWEMYWLDQDINDRGIQIDVDLAKAAMECDAQIGGKLMDEAKELTGLENPGSVQQMQGWLRSKGVYLESLGKELVQDQIDAMEKDPTADREALRMLKLRVKMAKSSVKKYDAAERCTCEDGRARGLFQFYGAQRTGRFAGRHIQLQNLKRNSINCLKDMRSLIKAGEYDTLDMLCDDVPDILSQCVRTMLVPKPGHEFIVADFSAIEARCIAWEAGEKSTLQDFRNGKDLYCAMASKMFGVPVEKHGQNAELRSRGKIAVLACLVQGSLVLTNQGLIPIEDVTLDMKLWDGEEWVQHDGVIYKGIREVIDYEGLTATEDHLVFVEGESMPVPLGIAAARGKKLVRTEFGGEAIRMQTDNIRRNDNFQKAEKICLSAMPELRDGNMGGAVKSRIESENCMCTLPANEGSTLAGKTYDSSKTEVRKPEVQAVQFVRGTRNKVRISIRDVRSRVYDTGIRDSRSKYGNRPDKHKWKLCPRKPSLCRSGNELFESAKKCVDTIRSKILAVQLSSSHSEAIARGDQRRDNFGRGISGVRPQEELAGNKRKARVYDIRNAGRHHRFTVSGVLVHNCGYGGSAGAMIAMGALKMGLKEDELPGIVQAYREANPNIVKFWWELDNAATDCIKDHQEHDAGIVRFEFNRNVLWMVLPSGRKLAYVAPRIGKNRFGGRSIEFQVIGLNNKWQKTETYGAKLSENCLRRGTLVLTSDGWKPIEIVSIGDEVWDGEEWVSCNGSIYKGIQQVVEVSFGHHYGLFMTPDHLILTESGWTAAGKAEGMKWEKARMPEGFPKPWDRAGTWNYITVYKEYEEKVPVYDIMDCGPRNRFCVQDPGTGAPRIVHNCTQAIARDILCNSIKNLEAEGIRVVAHVHDECICEVPIGKYAVDDICQIMARNPEWCKELPLTAAGYLAPDYYFKD